MGIRKRIVELERKTTGDGFCSCGASPPIEIHYLDRSDGSEDVLHPNFCERCRKPTQKIVIEVAFVEGQSIKVG